MSSDSEDDCYGNIAQKLHSIKSQFHEDKIQTTSLLNSSQPVTSKAVDKPIEIADNSLNNVCEITNNDSDCEEISLDTIIAQNTTKRAQRRSKRNVTNTDISVDNIITAGSRKRTRASKTVVSDPVDLVSPQVVSDLNEHAKGKRGRGQQRGRKNTRNSSLNTTNTNTNTNNRDPPPNINTRILQRNIARRARASSNRGQVSLPQFISAVFGLSDVPTYSVGNTDEYPDESHDQPLFTNQPKQNEVVVVNENESELNYSLDENEELSVKVFWQSTECIKFNIRRFQKLQSIFDFFAKREKVGHDKLFFTYNDKILKPDDTPDSITYNIAKFIDGGITNQNVSNIVNPEKSKRQEGIKLKFQCQNVKKPYEVYIRIYEKIAVAMMRCAEHLEWPLEKLKFYFDGDLISGKNSPRELDLEGGECIDVKMIS